MTLESPGAGPDPPDSADLTRLYQEHLPRLRAMLERRIDPRFARRIQVDDLLCEAFLAAQRRWSYFRSSSMSPLSWLYLIGLDQLREAVRRETRGCRDARLDIPWPERSSAQLGLGLLASITSASKVFERGEIERRVRRALDELKPVDREILWLKHFDGMSTDEISAMLGLEANTVYQRLGRALRRLKKQLADLASET